MIKQKTHIGGYFYVKKQKKKSTSHSYLEGAPNTKIETIKMNKLNTVLSLDR